MPMGYRATMALMDSLQVAIPVETEGTSCCISDDASAPYRIPCRRLSPKRSEPCSQGSRSSHGKGRSISLESSSVVSREASADVVRAPPSSLVASRNWDKQNAAPFVADEDRAVIVAPIQIENHTESLLGAQNLPVAVAYGQNGQDSEELEPADRVSPRDGSSQIADDDVPVVANEHQILLPPADVPRVGHGSLSDEASRVGGGARSIPLGVKPFFSAQPFEELVGRVTAAYKQVEVGYKLASTENLALRRLLVEARTEASQLQMLMEGKGKVSNIWETQTNDNNASIDDPTLCRATWKTSERSNESHVEDGPPPCSRNRSKVCGESSDDCHSNNSNAEGSCERRHPLDNWGTVVSMLLLRLFSAGDDIVIHEVWNQTLARAKNLEERSSFDTSMFTDLRVKHRVSAFARYSLSKSLSSGSVPRWRWNWNWGPPCFHPHSVFRLLWVFIGLIFMGYDMIGFTMQVFEVNRTDFARTAVVVGNAYWTVDIFLSFTTAIFVEGNLCTDSKTIILAYLKSWFLFDAGLIAAQWAIFVIEDPASRVSRLGALKYIRVTRFSRIIRMLKMFSILPSILELVTSPLCELALEVGQFFYSNAALDPHQRLRLLCGG
eukprot:TRINITY_DN6802_c1_g1_i1.p1 TRINITY_DN6802_c1_g1~~TRINITY_DN6802_c1_g1_i1.p1  ORF type:complete len:609 (+),score=68.53 TRINITY_DN6802_c1_g1_i1:102-1928(+)